MRNVLGATVTLLVFAFLAVSAAATEPTGYDLEVTCGGGELTIIIGDYEVGMTSYRLNGDDGTWNDIHATPGINTYPIPPDTKDATVWITLGPDHQEVDPKASCQPTSTC